MSVKEMQLIIWKDAASIDAWTPVEELEGSCSTIYSLGFVVLESEESVVLAGSYDTDGDSAACCIIIPRSCIISRAILEGHRLAEI